jgi:hypothetical protein
MMKDASVSQVLSLLFNLTWPVFLCRSSLVVPEFTTTSNTALVTGNVNDQVPGNNSASQETLVSTEQNVYLPIIVR